MRVGSFLMTTASTFNQSGEALHSRFQQLLRSEPIAQKVEYFLGLADVAFFRVDGELQGVENGGKGASITIQSDSQRFRGKKRTSNLPPLFVQNPVQGLDARVPK